MKTIAILAFATTAAIAATETAVPVAFNKERYEETRATSPFVLATKVEKVDETPKVDPFANMFIVGLGKADGKDYVTISEVGKEATPIRLYGSEPGEDGITVQQVNWSDAFGKSTVKIKKGSDIGEIRFNENAIKSAVAGTPVPQNAQGNRPPGATGGTVPPGFSRPGNSLQPTTQPSAGIPRPGGGTSFQPPGASSVPRPTGTQPPAQTGGAGAPTQSRQRIRVIGK